MRIGLQLFDGPGGPMLADFGLAESVEISDAEHGFEALTAVVPMTEYEALRWYARPGAFWAVLSAGYATAWEGRVEDVAVVSGGLRLTALGAWRALSDAPYTALWSKTGVEGWRPVDADTLTGRKASKFSVDNNNRLFVGLMKNAVYAALDSGSLAWFSPHQGEQLITWLTFDYALLAATGWTGYVLAMNEGYGSPATVWSLGGNGTLKTGTATVTVSPGKMGLELTLRNTSGGNISYSGENGDQYLRITNLRVTAMADSVTATDIAEAVVGYISAINPEQLSDSTDLIEATKQGLDDAVYEDARLGEVLANLAALGGKGGQYETGVWEGRRLHFRPRFAASRTWLVDVDWLELQRTMETLQNEMYGVYRDAANNRRLRTAVARADSSDLDAFTRRGYVESRTSSLAQAESLRDSALESGARQRPRAAFSVTRLYDEFGAGPYPLWLARAGDLVMVRNLPPELGEAVDRARRLRIRRKRYFVHLDELELTPEVELPNLAAMVAERER